MAVRLFAIHGSHPCATVERALELKGVETKVVELPAAFQPPVMRLRFGGRTVPGIVFEDGERVQGSRAILDRLEQRVPEPALLPADEDRRAAVRQAEAWGDEVLQPLVRRVLWSAFKRRPAAMVGYQEGGRLPPLPAPVVRLLAPLVLKIEWRLNDVKTGSAAADLAALPAHLDKVDAWLADGTLGGEGNPNVADLQIAPSLRLLSTLGDVRRLLDGRPCDGWARSLFPRWPGDVPEGTLAA